MKNKKTNNDTDGNQNKQKTNDNIVMNKTVTNEGNEVFYIWCNMIKEQLQYEYTRARVPVPENINSPNPQTE